MEGTLTIDRLNNLLDELSKAGGKMCATDLMAMVLHIDLSLRDQQTTIMTAIYNNCTPTEQRWIVRIILKGRLPKTPVAHMRAELLLRPYHLCERNNGSFCIS